MRKAWVGMAIAAALLLFSILFGGIGDVDTANRLQPPSLEQPFGTDTLGRSILERTAGGVLVSLLVAVLSAVLSLLIAILFAFLYSLERFPKALLLSITDSLKSIPSIILALFLASLSGPGIMKVVVAVSVSHIADLSRTAYIRTESILKEGFIEAGKCLGMKPARLFAFHILPHMAGSLALQSVSVLLSAVIAESTLSYLGCGVPVPLPSLGAVLQEARPLMLTSPWMVAFPFVVLILLALSLQLIALSFSELDSASERS